MKNASNVHSIRQISDAGFSFYICRRNRSGAMEFNPIKYPMLAQIDTPADLRQLPEKDLPKVCNELRRYIIDVVAVRGGHFGANLGAVELTVALHYVFDTPHDRLVWDVGHQAYGHKILTGRRDRFPTIRQPGGLSGFPKRAESEYDTFGVGHSSTSISAALGMAVASRLKGEHRKHVAVIGDGALTGGMAFEALNHAGAEKADLLVVLNDNQMSIDPNVGALKEYLTAITVSSAYNKFRDEVWNVLTKLKKVAPHLRELVGGLEKSLKSLISSHSNFFESLHFRYFGPVDGHDVLHLVRILRDLKELPGPKLLHALTLKGKGYLPAEENQTKWHSTGGFDKLSGASTAPPSDAPQPPKYQDVFGKTVVELAERNDKIVVITPAMPTGSSVTYMMERFPERAFDVGIAEQHAVTFSAALAAEGLRPFCAIYSTFLQRGYDQLIHDVAIQKLPVVFCIDRAGLVGEDGPTHHGAFDLAYMRPIPNLIIAAPMNEQELRNLMYTAQLDHIDRPFAIRYPRGRGVMVDWQTPFEEVAIGKGRLLTDGSDVLIISIGHVGNAVQKAVHILHQKDIYPAHFDARFLKPLDEASLHELLPRFRRVITVEDGTVLGGLGDAVLDFGARHGYSFALTKLGIPDRFIDHAPPALLHKECGYDADGIVRAVEKMLEPAWSGQSKV